MQTHSETGGASGLSSREREVLEELLANVNVNVNASVIASENANVIEKLDSLDRLSLLVEIEDRFQIVLPDDELQHVRTLGDLCRLIVRIEASP